MQVSDYGFVVGMIAGVRVVEKAMEKLPFLRASGAGGGTDRGRGDGGLSEHQNHMLEKTYDISLRNQDNCDGHDKMLEAIGRITSSQERIAWILENIEKRIV